MVRVCFAAFDKAQVRHAFHIGPIKLKFASEATGAGYA